MPHEAMRAVDDALRDLPVADRLSLLLVSIIKSNSDALSISFRMLDATMALSRICRSKTGFESRKRRAITPIAWSGNRCGSSA